MIVILIATVFVVSLQQVDSAFQSKSFQGELSEEFCRYNLQKDRTQVIKHCDWIIPPTLRQIILDCAREYTDFKQDDRPLFCIFLVRRYEELIVPCIDIQLKHHVFDRHLTNQTTIDRIEYDYLNCYKQMIWTLTTERTTRNPMGYW